MEEHTIQEREKKVFSYLKNNTNWVAYLILILLVLFAIWLRALPMQERSDTGHPGLWDITTNSWTLGPDLDPFLFLRWAKYVDAHGSLFSFDTMRYVPVGFNVKNELTPHVYMMAWFHKLAALFGSESITQSAVIYPVFMFALTVIAFFFMTRKIFLEKLGKGKAGAIATISSFFLIIIPSLLPRTIAGIPEKESSGFFFLFAAFYLFLSAWKAKTTKYQIILALLAGLATAGMAGVWGGYIFILITISLSLVIAFFLGLMDRKKITISVVWIVSAYLVMNLMSSRYSLQNLVGSTTTLLPLLVLAIIIFDKIIFETRLKDYVSRSKLSNIPRPVISAIIAVVIGLVIALIVFGPTFIIDKLKDFTKPLIQPITDRLGVTVAENRQPYFSEWANSFGPSLRDFFVGLTHLDWNGKSSELFNSIPIFFFLFLFGSIYLYHAIMKGLSDSDRRMFAIGYSLFLLAIIFSRFTSQIDKSSGFYNFYFLILIICISLILLMGFYLYKSKLFNTYVSFALTGLATLLPLIVLIGNQSKYLLNGINKISIAFYILGVFYLLFSLSSLGLRNSSDKNKNLYAWTAIAFLLFLTINYLITNNYNVLTLLLKITTLLLGLFLAILSLIQICRISLIERDFKDNLDFGFILLFSFFFLSIVSARGAVRTIMVLAPAGAILVSYLIIVFGYKSIKEKNKESMYGLGLILSLLLVLSSIYSAYAFYSESKSTAENYIPNIYSQQWQLAMKWVRDNTATDAVFGHWWDYGYWVQSIGERATVLDGGNSIPYWDHLMGRYALTGANNREAVDFLYAHKTTHFLIDSTDIGKYSAFSSIGSDENYDRASFIPTFLVDKQNVQENKNSTSYLYQGGAGVDGDIVYEINGTKVFLPAGKAAIGGVVVERDKNGKVLSNPVGVYIYQNKQYRIPFRYAYSHGKLTDFGSGMEAGILLLPSLVQSSQGFSIDKDSALLYLSGRTVNSQLGRLYLFNENDPYFKLVHSEDDLVIESLKKQKALDENEDFLNYGGFRGPIRIWEIEYPSDIKVNQDYLKTEYPDIKLLLA